MAQSSGLRPACFILIARATGLTLYPVPEDQMFIRWARLMVPSASVKFERSQRPQDYRIVITFSAKHLPLLVPTGCYLTASSEDVARSEV